MLPNEHLAGALHEVGVELQVVEALAGLRERRHRRLGGVQDLDQHMNAGVGCYTPPGELGRDLSGLGFKDDLMHSGFPFRGRRV